MKQKKNQSNLVTKDFLKKEFKQFDKRFDQKLTILEVRTDIKQDRLERRIDDNAKKYRDQILTSNDKLAKLLETIRDENAIGFNQINDKLQNYEERIHKLEHIQTAA